MNKKVIADIFQRFKLANPKPTTELNFNSNFELLIAVLLSAQATDVSVNKVTDKLYKVANTPESILALGEERLKEYIKSIGLFNSKARNAIKTCQILVDQHNSIVPNTLAELQALPGVGRKTANVILNTAFQQATMAVDTHIFRVGNRIGITKAKNVLESEQQYLKKIPKMYLYNAHHWLILHGRYTCKARKPECRRCIINDLCQFKEKTL